MKNLIGTCPTESGFISKFRKHQGWWRTFVLNEKEGEYYSQHTKKTEKVCNRINDGDIHPEVKNFLSKEISEEVQKALNRHKRFGSGIIETDRLYNNLLSSQPLAFNFFGFFRANPDIALAFLQTLRPDIISVEDYLFEYAPESSVDSSAFDFGFIIKTINQRGFIGFECKYTDTFSYQRTIPNEPNVYYGDEGDKNFKNYHQIYLDNRDRFSDDYFSYVRDKNYNQLFRNELLGMLIKIKPDIDFILTGLFCHHDDKKIVSAAKEFQKKIGNGKDDFILLTYADYLERMQKLNLNWEQRELVMMLWARYCGLKLSIEVINCMD
jgi:hypothetical protein